jgi:hypothetical protein
MPLLKTAGQKFGNRLSARPRFLVWALTADGPDVFDAVALRLPAASLVIRRVLRRLVVAMNEFEQLACDVRVFATEVRRLGYSSVPSGHENQFLELSERMIRRVDGLNRLSNSGNE